VRNARCRLPAVLLVALLAGCASLRVPQPAGSVPDPAVVTQWTAKGRIGFSAQGEGGSGSFVWRQLADRTELELRGPLGAGGVDLTTDGSQLELRDASGSALDGEAARAELERRLGGTLPLAQLRYWILGVPAPPESASGGGPAQMATGAVPGFVQDGWVVSLDRSREFGGWRLPVRLSATTSRVRIKLVIDDWQVQP
jgi:outer membrane lipoprotein LolB